MMPSNKSKLQKSNKASSKLNKEKEATLKEIYTNTAIPTGIRMHSARYA